MYFGFIYKSILKNYFNNFNKNFINYVSGKYNENEFKILRLQYGLYRQRFSYMYRICVNCGILNYNQLLLISYVSFVNDNFYYHFTTRTNIQLNWVKLFYIFEILKKISFLFIHSIQTSGNCVRNITSSIFFKKLNIYPWSELIRQWFTFNSEYLFFPRKFKIFISSKSFDNSFKVHDLGFYFKKNCTNNILFHLLVGGGLGRTPTIGFYLFSNLHWKNIINYTEKIIRLYNFYGFRNNIYKSRIKILFKLVDRFHILNFIKMELNYSNKYLYFINEKNINYFFNINFFSIENLYFNKKIVYNYFFLNWFINNNYCDNFFYLVLKNYNISPGDIYYIQAKILYFFFSKYKILKILNRQNLIISFFNSEHSYLKLKRYFFNIYNFNSITDMISCPGKDYCVLANSKSIFIFNIITSLFLDFNTIFKLKNIKLNVSGCVNSCSHHHISYIGFLGVIKNNNMYYQIYNNSHYRFFNYLVLSKPFSSSIIYYKVSLFFMNLLKINFN